MIYDGRGEEKREGAAFDSIIQFSTVVHTKELRGCVQRNNTLKFDTIIKLSKHHVHSSLFSSKLYAEACDAKS